MTYFEQVSPCYIENWTASLCRLSIAEKDLPLTLDEARALGANITEYGDAFDLPFIPDISLLRDRVREAVAGFPHGAFIRLGSRSPKDSWTRQGPEGMKVLAGDADPLRFLTGGSERMSDDLLLALTNNYAPHLFVREWLTFPAWAEFRCFQKGGRLVGVSQYNYHSCYPEIMEFRSLITWGVDTFHARDFAPASHLSDVVFDVIALVHAHGNERAIEIKLLEINPWGEFTDPCLFDHRRGGDFDRTFRFVLADKGEARYRI